MKNFIINENDSGQRVNKFIEKVFFRVPKSLIYKLIRKKNIKLNHKKCNASDVLKVGDFLEVFCLDEFFKKDLDRNSKNSRFKGLNKLKIVYEDNNLIVVNKPVGLKSHADGPFEEGLIERIILYLEDSKKYCKSLENSFKPALCNRLDRNTSGLILAAKNSKTLREVNRLNREEKILKIYSCKAEGFFEKKHETLVGFWKKSFKFKKAIITKNYSEGLKKTVTKYVVLKQLKNYADLRVEIKSGRYHQIRAHLASIGHPIVGDLKYGSKIKNCGLQLVSWGLVLDSKNSSLDYLDGKTFLL